MLQPSTLVQAGAANALFDFLPVIILIAIVIIILGKAESSMGGASPAARRGFVKGIVSVGVISLIVGTVVAPVIEIISETDVGSTILNIDSNETYSLSGTESYTGVDIEESGTLVFTSGSQLNIRE